MSAAAQSPSLPRSHSTRRQPPPLNGDTANNYRPGSGSHRTSAPSSPRRSVSSPQSSHSRQPNQALSNVQRHDYEQSSLDRPRSSRKSESRDYAQQQPPLPPPPPSTVSRTADTHARSSSRYNEAAPAPPSQANGSMDAPAQPRQPTNLRRRTTVDAQTGCWELGKTIGAGSMGKVKLARNKETGEQVAVKIVPRLSNENEHRTPAERERADHSKEVRTAREAAIVTLVDHPYICGMRDVVRTNYHWYMLFEYVNGGQMLDYIISHGRLKEKQARKFGRQIASALDYCHRNSIVHRDLKIENILISKTGDIKIIDFGLSNLFSPRSLLKTFCGSLYFAAPELLQAKQYTGPEVDVWSFGIVLYVLVCGKVPFDDQSMPQLHAKIKKGYVEYPPWLSPECKSLISRMLTTDPSQRATISDVMSHPWMTKGFSGTPDNYLPSRRPITLPLDEKVVEKMTGFDFGPAEIISQQLTKIVESEEYQRAVRLAEKRAVANHQTPEFEKKRGVFDFYKRRNSTTSRDTLNTPSSEALQIGLDPINAFSPLLSIYYLAREKIEREAREANPGALAIPTSPNERPLQLPEMPTAPQSAYTNAYTPESAGEDPTGGRTRPRARTHGEDDAAEARRGLGMKNMPNSNQPSIVLPPEQAQTNASQRKESTAAGLLRRFSTRKHKGTSESDRGRSDKSHPPPSLAVYAPQSDAEKGTPRKSFSMRRPRDSSTTGLRPDSQQQDRLTPPPIGSEGAGASSGGESKPSRNHGLGRSVSVNSSDIRRRLSRRGVSEGSSMRPPITTATSSDRKHSMDTPRPEPSSDVEPMPQRPTTGGGGTNRAKSMGHARKESYQARRARREMTRRESNVPEETDAELADEVDTGHNSSGSPTGIKPVYLKGLFSVSTTSSRPLSVIRSDIIRVLKQLGVEYKEIKGGFSCRHAPSIDMLKAGVDDVSPAGAAPLSPPSGSGHRRKISFGGFMDRTSTNEGSAREEFRNSQQQQEPTHKPSREAAGYTDVENSSDEEHAQASRQYHGRKPSTARPAGETSTHVQDDRGQSMILRFEIFIVKVPLLSLHGIQFKKVDGGTWQYKNMAQTILNELKL
ncbi:Pkinase-domain-containing protein [Polychaeton citri CBS 116435]|uniref:non-specific serine/threonine protein kinase n=1 Tax=Polychaeton citri CBS 116435 TaxID=1314669 RepID=A0A9P4UKS2_9PEZI|nr:Pkinase-domain-containing protein [Polychaeton citri CBS 116435]